MFRPVCVFARREETQLLLAVRTGLENHLRKEACLYEILLFYYMKCGNRSKGIYNWFIIFSTTKAETEVTVPPVLW